MSLLQWNCNGLKRKLNELKILCQKFNPIAIAIQETRLKETNTISIDELNLIVLNDGSATHFSTAYQTFSAIDLTLISLSLAPLAKWKVLQDLHHSDHFPIICELARPPKEQQHIRKK